MSTKNQCTLFDFMAHNVGVKVLHPGGYKATKELCNACNISSDSKVLDLACGVGTSSFFLHKNYGCSVTGVDIDVKLIEFAKKTLSQKANGADITFQVGDAFALPFPDNSFDVIISQAFFILIDDQELALKEMHRVLKPGGVIGSIELSWLQEPTESIYTDLVKDTCSSFIPRVKSVDKWSSFFTTSGLQPQSVSAHIWKSGMLKMIESEGIANTFKIMGRMMTNPPLRKKMMTVQSTFKKHQEYIGYGIYSFVKGS